MKRKTGILLIFPALIAIASIAFKNTNEHPGYTENYFKGLETLNKRQSVLLHSIAHSDLSSEQERSRIKEQLHLVRSSLKFMDFWFRYLEPVSYKKINGPLPVEWETEVFEKFEKPYRREGAGLTLAELYLEEQTVSRDSLGNLIRSSINAARIYQEDSITTNLKTFDHFYLCNRLFLLNLAAIYTTGFECPDPGRIIPEVGQVLAEIYPVYQAFNQSFPDQALPENYLNLFKSAQSFVRSQPQSHEQFDHFTFIKTYVNPLFSLNQQLIRNYKVVTKSYVDYALNKNATSIFSKSLYKGQNSKGIFLRVYDEAVLAEIDQLGKLLFYDPILSGNNLRSCASCHKPDQFFTDTLTSSHLQFDRINPLPRNSPSLINAAFNHLIMADGQHISLQDQTKAVITNSLELACAEKDVLKKILSCADYKEGFRKLLKYTPWEKEVSMAHITAAITIYYSKFGQHSAPFDDAINQNKTLAENARKGFNVFMGKAQCATCHFAPQFNGVKPPYVGSEFEVLGVPKDTSYKHVSSDKGRYLVNPADQTLHAFRTGTIRNSGKTAPYMHNGVFKDLNSVIEFYDGGGGAGRGLQVPNQTLSSDSLHLSKEEKNDLIAFMHSLTENIPLEQAPLALPKSKIKHLNRRKVGGEY